MNSNTLAPTLLKSIKDTLPLSLNSSQNDSFLKVTPVAPVTPVSDYSSSLLTKSTTSSEKNLNCSTNKSFFPIISLNDSKNSLNSNEIPIQGKEKTIKLLNELKSILNLKGNLFEKKTVPILLDIMAKENLAEIIKIPIEILQHGSVEVLNEFKAQKGLLLIAKWLDAFKDKIEMNLKLDQKELGLIDQLLNLCYIIPIISKDLKSSKLGKIINKLSKNDFNNMVKAKCRTLVEKWKNDIHEQHEEQKSDEESQDSQESQSSLSDFIGKKRERSNNQGSDRLNNKKYSTRLVFPLYLKELLFISSIYF